MAGFVPADHVFVDKIKTWMPGTRPGMTNEGFATGLENRSPG
jgi:hypothetical protein